MPTRPGGAFVLRCWTLGDGSRRVEVTHVRSGERAIVPSTAAAAAWIEARAGPARPDDGGEARETATDGDDAIENREERG